MCPLSLWELGSHHAATVSVSCCLEGLFPWCPPPPLVVKIFLLPILQGSLILEGKELTEISHSGLTLPRSVTFCSLSSCSLCISSHLSQEEASPWWLNETMTYGYSRMPFVVIFFLFFAMFLMQNSGICFRPRSLARPILGSWQPEQCCGWIPSNGVSLKSNRILVE